MRSNIGVDSIIDKMRENRLRWLKHVFRKEEREEVQLKRKYI